jgi:hypothetical protein
MLKKSLKIVKQISSFDEQEMGGDCFLFGFTKASSLNLLNHHHWTDCLFVWVVG